MVFLFASGSKAIILSVMLVYLINSFRGFEPRRVYLALVTTLIAVSYLVSGDIIQRIEDFILYGDPWRVEEPRAAIEKILDPVVFFLGNGSGFPYWGGRASLVYFYELERVTFNSLFDVHNGILTLFLRFGVPGGLVALYLITKPIPRRDIINATILFYVVLSNIFLSHGPIQTVEAIGLVLGLRLIEWRENSVRALK